MTHGAPIRSFLSWYLGAAVLSAGALACDPMPVEDEAPRDGELMFELDEEELVAFHETYVANGDLELTRERLTAPFECGLYGDFCDQVGRDAAIEISGQQVELAREGVSLEEMNAQTLGLIAEAMEVYEPDDEDISFRGTSNWSTRTKGDNRLRVRHGITTPWSGDREAWTQSKFQHRDWLGVWWQVKADVLCANTGVNTLTINNSGIIQTMESKNPGEVCWYDRGSYKQITTHARWDSHDDKYEITVNGCGSADNNGTHFGICRNAYREQY
ncbi:MAG: hypothetical protein AAF799_39845 [Myxococcota bacterium]